MPTPEPLYDQLTDTEGESQAAVHAIDFLGQEVGRPEFSLDSFYESWQEARQRGHIVRDQNLTRTFKKARAGDISEEVQLTDALSGYVALVASEYLPEGADEREYFEVGRSALLDFIRSYEVHRGRHMTDDLTAILAETYAGYEPESEQDNPIQPQPTRSPTAAGRESMKVAIPEQPVVPKKQRKIEYRILVRDGEELVYDLTAGRVVSYVSIAIRDNKYVPDKAYLPDVDDEFRELTKHRVLNPAEEQFLARRYRAGDPQAFDLLISHNYRLVASVANRRRRGELTFAERFQEGVTGLKRAIEKFDPDCHFKLSTYAVLWIKQRIDVAVADQARVIRLPRHVDNQLRAIIRAEEKLRSKHGYDPPDEETSTETGIAVEQIQRIRSRLHPASLDKPVVAADGEGIPGDLQADPAAEHAFLTVSDRQTLESLLEPLPTRTQEFIRAYYFDNNTYDMIGHPYGLSRERVRQVVNQGLEQMRQQLHASGVGH